MDKSKFQQELDKSPALIVIYCDKYGVFHCKVAHHKFKCESIFTIAKSIKGWLKVIRSIAFCKNDSNKISNINL